MARTRILIVDDSATARKLLASRLPQDRDFDVVEADRGEKAIEAYRAQRADLVLLDLTMPEMDGYEVLKKLVELDKSANVVVVSADVQDEARRRVLESGAREYVAKPVSAAEVARIIAAHI